MNEMCKYRRPYTCKECGQEMLFFPTKNNTIIDYKRLLLKNCNTLRDVKHALESGGVKRIKCVVCGKYYIMDWTNGLPEQFIDPEVCANLGI
jgi:hypothetical protein